MVLFSFHRPTGHRAGMTLIEMMVVIVVLGIVAGMMIPQMGGTLATMQLRTAAGDLRDLMDYSYHAAVTRGRVHALVFDPQGRQFEVLQEMPPEGMAADRQRDPTMTATPADLEGEAPRPIYPTVDPTQPPQLQSVSIPGYVNRSLPEGITMTSVATFEQDLTRTQEGDVRLLFFPDGTCEFATITLVNQDGDQVEIDVNGLSGLIQVGDVTPAGMETATGTEAGSL